MQSWREFWDSDHAIYVNAAHKAAHQAIITQDIAAHLNKDAIVLDFGCGETPFIKSVQTLYLCEGAPQILKQLQKTYGDFALAPEALTQLPQAHFSHIIMVSVLQYLSLHEFETRLQEFHMLLAPEGELIIADIIDPQTGPLQDARALLMMGWRHEFFFAALWGLVKTALSPYRQLRANLGFTRLTQDEMQAILHKAGFKSIKLTRNIGPHQHRYSMKATRL
jgi:ubiquinone/menaquinone biosynthesis C-methylase UbiE